MERIDAFRQRVLERENRIWDKRRGVDTRGWVVPTAGSTSSGVADGFPYAGTHVRLGRAMLRSLRSSAPGATFIDLGAGKGRVLLLAAELPFAAVVGVEYSEELVAVAQRNLETLGALNGARPRIELADVRDYAFPSTPLVIYLNNPFPEPVFTAVLENLASSYRALPRPVAIVYQQLRHEDAEHDTGNVALIETLDFLERRRIGLRGLANLSLLQPYAVHAFVTV